MQNICQEKLDWDEMLSKQILKDWHDCLTKLEKHWVLKHTVFLKQGITLIQYKKKKKLHGFCDASLNGYEGCIYVKTTYKPRKISVKIL